MGTLRLTYPNTHLLPCKLLLQALKKTVPLGADLLSRRENILSRRENNLSRRDKRFS